MRNPLVVGKTVRHLQRTTDHLVVVAAGALAHVGVRKVGDSQQQVAQRHLDLGVLVVERLLAFAERTTFGHQRLGVFLLPAQHADLLRKVVDSGPGCVAFCGDVAQPHVETHCMIEHLQQFGLCSPGECRMHRVGLRAKQPDINHNEQG